jgi:hypothetical protein
MARFVAGDHHGAGAGFGHRPGIDHRNAEPVLERGVVARIDAGCETEPHMMRPVVRGRFETQQHGWHHAEAVQNCCFGFAHRLPPVPRMEPVEWDDAAAREHHGECRISHRIDVGHR